MLDAEAETFHAWRGKALPTSALIDRLGRLRYVGLGPLEWDGAEAVGRVEALLDDPVSVGAAVERRGHDGAGCAA